MTERTTSARQHEWLDLVWAIVLIQGGILVLSTIESLVVNVTQGFLLIGVSILTGLGATATLFAARGLRRHRPWARRLTMVGESFVLVLGVVEIVASQLLDPSGIDLVPVITGVLFPVSVLVMLRRSKPLFARRDAASDVLRTPSAPMGVGR